MTEIQQALFGYSNGHHLLMSSDRFSSSELKVIEPLSDISGNFISDEFDGYLTGYNLKSKNCYVLSKTWYAKEMQRPGCVWTHALLIPFDETMQSQFSNLDFNKCFKRPNINDVNWKEYYATPIVLEKNICNNDFAELENGMVTLSESLLYLLVNDYSPIIITEEKCSIYNDILINLIKNYGINFFKDISFCTGSFTNRKYNGEYFSLQIVPQSISRSVWRTKEKNRIIDTKKIFNSIKVDNYNINNLEYAKEFILSLSNVEFTRRALMFGLFYTKNTINTKEFSLKQLMSSAQQYFDNIETLREIAENAFAKFFINGNIDINKKIFMEFCSVDLDIINWELNIVERKLPQFINNFFDLNKNIIYNTCEELIEVKANRLGEKILKLIAIRLEYEDINYFIKNNYKAAKVFIYMNCSLAAEDDIWKKEYDVQCDVLKIIEKIQIGNFNTDMNLYKRILIAIFETSTEDIINIIYKTFGEYAIRVFFEWSVLVSNLEKIKRWVPICKYNIELSISEITNIHSKDIFSLVINNLDPYDKNIQKVSIKVWERLFKEYCKEPLNNYECKQIFAQFILPVILQSKKNYPEEIVYFAFSTVHKILAEDKMPYSRWIKLSQLLPEVPCHKEWDKCKRLRKAAKKMNCKLEL